MVPGDKQIRTNIERGDKDSDSIQHLGIAAGTMRNISFTWVRRAIEIRDFSAHLSIQRSSFGLDVFYNIPVLIISI